jgi:hypothetical protein
VNGGSTECRGCGGEIEDEGRRRGRERKGRAEGALVLHRHRHSPLPRKEGERFLIFLGGFFDDCCGEMRRGRGFIPV